MHTYCLVLRPQHFLNSLYPTHEALLPQSQVSCSGNAYASEEWLVFGVEPARMFALPPQGDRSVSAENSIVASSLGPIRLELNRIHLDQTVTEVSRDSLACSP